MGEPASEPRWSPFDRDIVIAWQQYRDSLCDMCGLPREICHDPDVIKTWEAELQTCEVSALMERAHKRLRDQADPDTVVETYGVHAIARRKPE